MGLNIHVERLGLHGVVGRVVHSRDCTSRGQVMEVTSQLGELSPGVILLPLVLILHRRSEMVVQLFADFFVFSLDVRQVVLPGVEIMLVFARVVTTITDTLKVYNHSSQGFEKTNGGYLLFLNNLGLFVEEPELAVVILCLDTSNVLFAALKATEAALD